MNPLKAIPITEPAFRGVLSLLILGPIAAAIVAISVSEATAEHIFREGGPIEEQSMLLWLALAVFCVATLGVRSLAGWAGFVLSLAAAAREADWHLQFTGYSVLKIPFYYRPQYPIEAKLIAGAAVLLIGAATAIILYKLWRRAKNSGRKTLPVWGWTAIAAVAALGVSKVLDRSENVLEESFGIILPELVGTSVWAMEETSEMILPLAFGAAILCFVMTGDNARRGSAVRASTAQADQDRSG